MGKDAPAAPQPVQVDPYAQGAANEKAALTSIKASNPNIINPLGSQTISYDADNIPTVTQTLTPRGQSIFDTQQDVKQQLANLSLKGTNTASGILGGPMPQGSPLQTTIDTSNFAQLPVNAGTTGQEAILSRLQPTLARRSAALDQNLANQGITRGSEAYTNAMRDENLAQNDLLTQAALQGIGLDTGIRAQQFNEAQSQMGAQNAANQAELQRQLSLRQAPLNEITALASGSQIALPQFQGFTGSNIAPAPIMAATQANNASNLANYGLQSANYNAANQGLYGLGGAALNYAGTDAGSKFLSSIPGLFL